MATVARSVSAPILTLVDVEDFERRRQIVLPTDYRQFLLRFNGGRPTPSVFDVPGWAGRLSAVGDFLGLRRGDACDLEFWIDELSERLPEELIPIGGDPGGNFICMCIRGPDVGTIYYWDASPDWGLSAETGNVFAVAPSFETFLDGLKEMSEPGRR